MKKLKYICRLITYLIIFVICYPVSIVKAQTNEFPSLYLQTNTNENTIVLTKETSNDDENWQIAGITDVTSEKENFDSKGVQAIFYNKESHTTVRLMAKESTKSKSIFHLSSLNEEDLASFYTSMSVTDDSATATIESYEQAETLFFRYEIKTNTGLTELIYGSILNGYMISFDSYTENSGESINEEYLISLVDETHITEFLEPTKAQEIDATSILFLLVPLALITLIVVLLIMRSNKKRKKETLLRNQKAERMTEFFKEQREKEKLNVKSTRLFANTTIYTEALVKQFTMYNLYIKQIKVWLISGIGYVVLLAVLSGSENGSLKVAVGFLLLFVFLYFQYVQVEKMVKRTMKLYDNKDTELDYQFYEDYFTVKEHNSTTKYPYLQLMEVREFKGCIFLYRSTEHAFILEKENFEDEKAFITFIRQRL